MHFRKTLLVLLAIALTSMSMAKGREKSFFLVDQRTQMPVLSCPVQPNWRIGGKATWTADPAAPVSWYVWTLSPDQKVKIIFSSLVALGSPGQIQQVPFLQNPLPLANELLPAVQRDHNLADLHIVDAHFNNHEPPQDLIESRMLQARQHGITPTNFLFTELYVRYDGLRNGKKYIVILSLPMLATENRPGMGFATVVELLLPTSFSCPPDREKDTQRRLEKLVEAIQMNPNFTAVVNQVAAQRTENWLRVQNEIRSQQLEIATSASTTQDRVRDMWSEYIRDVDTTANPNTGEKMFIDSHYDHAWINSDNEIIYHNSGFNTPNASTASFDPNSNALFNQTTWRQLK